MKFMLSGATAATLSIILLTIVAACETGDSADGVADTTVVGGEPAQMGTLIVNAEGEFDDSLYVEVTGPDEFLFIDPPCRCCPPITCFLRLDSLEYGEYTVDARGPDSLYRATNGVEGELLLVYSNSATLTAEEPVDTIMVTLGQ